MPTLAQRGIVPVLAFTGIAVAAMQTLTVPIIADLPELLHSTPSNASWVVTFTLLSGTVAAPILGRAGDLYGKRRVLLYALTLMILGSLLSGFTSDLAPMIAGRALRGLALGAIPLGIGIIWDQVPDEKRPMAIAFMSGSIGIGGALAIPVAAIIAENFDWHWIFFGTAFLGTLSIIFVFILIPEGPRDTGRFDILGAFGLTLGLTTLLIAISKGSEWGWGSIFTVLLLVFTAIIFTSWGLYELRTSEPLLNLHTASIRPVLLTNLTAIAVGMAFFVVTLVLPQLLQLPTSTGYGMGMSMTAAGFCGAVMGFAMMLVAPLAGRLTEKQGPKSTLVVGLILLTVTYLAGLSLLGEAWQVVLVAAFAGAGVGTAYAAMPELILSSVHPSETGAANGLNQLMRSVGTSISSAVISAVLAGTAHQSGSTTVPTLTGFKISFMIAAGVALLGLTIALSLPKTRKTDKESRSTFPSKHPVS